MKQSIVPWIIATIMCLYIYGLTYHAKNRIPPEPSYDFYDTTQVTVHITGSEEIHDVYGRFNNILEGERQLIKARHSGSTEYKLTFQVNSPRPAILYINDEDLEIFLVPGDTSLHVMASISPNTYLFDSLQFSGTTAGICNYYYEKTQKFQKVHIRATRNIIATDSFSTFCLKLDSLVAKELSFLVEKSVFDELPDWFINFERTEILYQKAYLKLSRAYNQNIDPQYLDQIRLDNPEAVFSYYYYLYLNSYFSTLGNIREPEGVSIPNISQLTTASQIQLADSLLTEGPHDVFITRTLFDHLQRGNIDFVQEMFDKYKNNFYSKKYYRFLDMQIKSRQKPV